MRLVLLCAFVAIPLLSGCGCEQMTAWRDLVVEVEDPTSEEALSTKHKVELALAQFAAWSAMERICVSSVTVVRELDQANGEYSYPSGIMEISESGVDPWRSTFHELCHAVDSTEDISVSHPGLFPERSVKEKDQYQTEDDRTREAFARLCGIGAKEDERFEIWQGECGLDGYVTWDLPALHLIQERVFPRAEHVPWEHPSFDLSVQEPWSPPNIGLGWEPIQVIAGEEDLIMLYSWDRRHGVESSSRRGVADGGLPDQHEGIRLLYLDPELGTVRKVYSIDPCALDPGHVSPSKERDGCDYGLIQSDSTPWFASTGRAMGASSRNLWRLDPSGPVQVPASVSPGTGLITSNDTSWSLWHEITTADLGVLGENMVNGESIGPFSHAPSYPLEDGYPSISPIYLVSAGNRPAVFRSGFGFSWLTDNEGTWEDIALPWHLSVESAAAMHDGRVLLSVLGYNSSNNQQTMTLARLDPWLGTLEAPRDACPLPIGENTDERRELHAGDGWGVLLDGEGLHSASTRIVPFRIE